MEHIGTILSILVLIIISLIVVMSHVKKKRKLNQDAKK
jgi:hypothetical protein